MCLYELDDRLDIALTNLYQKAYRSISAFIGNEVKIDMHKAIYLQKQMMPDAVKMWVIYCGALIAGAADGALTLYLHNLSREAASLERQIFEYVMKAWYFQRHPREAKRELEAMPFRDLHLLTETGFDRRTKRYRDLKAMCAQLKQTRPALARYAKKTERKEQTSLRSMIPGRGAHQKATYARAFRHPSQTVHATVLEMHAIFRENGVAFDSRVDNPDHGVLVLTGNVITYLTIIDKSFDLQKAAEIQAMFDEHQAIFKRLIP